VKVIIIGTGRLLYFVSRAFVAKGYRIVIISREHEECVQLARRLKATIVHGDGSDSEILREAGIIGADAVLAITPEDQDNLVICQLAKHQFGVRKTMALANDPDNVPIFDGLGVPAFSTTRIISSLIEERTTLEQVTNLLPVGEGRVNVTEIRLDSESPVVGQRLRDLTLPANTLIAVVVRDDQALIPGGATQLLPHDGIILITLPENHGPAVRALTGERK
jgi:trk system potassium uptake protein TrkA